MTATNHALTGAIIGLSLSNPYLAIPLTFASHFALDALPHWSSSDTKYLSSNKFLRNLSIDIILCLTLVIVLIVAQPIGWKLGIICAFLATSPDFMWIGRFVAARNHKAKPKLKNAVVKLHAKIQWFQRPIGAAVEVAWFISTIVFLRFLIT